MCGLIAVIPKRQHGFTKELVDIFDTLLFADQLRGMDSTGVFLVERDGTMSLAKEASCATYFRGEKEYQDLLTTAYRSGTALVGHNRAATRGEITDENAHPFVVDDCVTLVHNGTLVGDHKKLADTVVDSHAIAHVIHNHNDDVEAALKEINGAYALIWHDFKSQTINIIRNAQRPLHWMETDDAWIWASADDMLHWMIAKYKLKVTQQPNMLIPGTLVSYSRAKGVWECDIKELDVTPKTTYTTSWTPQQGHWNYAYGSQDEDNTKPWERVTTVSRIKGIEEDLADKLMSHYVYLDGQKAGRSFNSGSTVQMQCVETVDVIPTNKAVGSFLYGCLVENKEILVKVHMNATVNEMYLIDLAMNNRIVSVKLNSFAWTSYSNSPIVNGMVDGYVMYTAQDLKTVEAIACEC